MEIELTAGGRHEQPVTPGHAAFIYPFAGSIEIAGQAVDAHTLAILGDGDRIELSSDEGGRAILVAGRPIGEAIVRYGPFVMNTRDEIHAAIRDFQTGNF